MRPESIFGPVLGMMLLTFAVWVYMYVRRLSYVRVNRIGAQRLTTPARRDQIIPEEVSYPAYNLRNLIELPVIFYVLCMYLYLAEAVDTVYLYGAWLYFILRAGHSVIHCTVNVVVARFLVYMASAFVLWFMVLRAALGYL